MSAVNAAHLSVKIVRWIARIWSLLVLVAALLIIFTPGQVSTESVPAADWYLLGLWGVAVLGLLVAWRWELGGAIITIAAMFLREFSWILLRGHWMTNFLIVWMFVVPPALLFLLARAWERKTRKAE